MENDWPVVAYGGCEILNINRLSKKSFQPKDSEGRIVGKGTVRGPFP